MHELPILIRLLTAIPAYLLGIYYFRRAGKVGRYVALTYLVMILYGFLVEFYDIRTTHGYYYPDVLIMLGPPPNWVPLTICVTWATILFIAMTTSDRLGLPWFQRPLLDGTLAVTMDFMIDPVSSASRWVAALGDACVGSGPTFGGAGVWIWCVPEGDQALWYNVPLLNFFSWFLVIAGMSFAVRAARRYLNADERAWPAQLLILILGALLAGAVLYALISLYVTFVNALWAQRIANAAVILVPVALVVAQRRKLNFHNSRDLPLLAMPMFAYAGGLSTFFYMGISRDQWPWSAVLIVATAAVSFLLFLLPYLGTIFGGSKQAARSGV